MFSRKQHHAGYHFQPNQMYYPNMGERYYPVSPYINYPSQFPVPSYQHPSVAFQQQPFMNNNWNMNTLPNQNPYPSTYSGGKGIVQSIFQNPLEPKDPYAQQMQMGYNQMNFNPYPKPNLIAKPNGGIGTIMNSFKGQDGNIDLNKMMNTAGQMINAVSQVSSMVKGLGGMFKV
jgi:hypothetical protein